MWNDSRCKPKGHWQEGSWDYLTEHQDVNFLLVFILRRLFRLLRYSLYKHVDARRFHSATDSLPRSDHWIFLAGGKRKARVRSWRRRRLIDVIVNIFFTVATTRQFSQFTSHVETFSCSLYHSTVAKTFLFRFSTNLFFWVIFSLFFLAVEEINLRWHFTRLPHFCWILSESRLEIDCSFHFFFYHESPWWRCVLIRTEIFLSRDAAAKTKIILCHFDIFSRISTSHARGKKPNR